MDYPVWFDDTGFKAVLERFKGTPNLSFLQVGVYTGDATEWLLNNVLTDPSTRLTDVDTWSGSDEPAHKDMDFNEIYNLYTKRFSEPIELGKLKVVRATSDEFFAADSGVYDFIYVDADHHALQVYKDAINSWDRLAINGILAFDDYSWSISHDPLESPRYGIDKFLVEYQDNYTALMYGKQYWIQRYK